MKTSVLAVVAVLFLALSTGSYAIDNNAKFIDSIGAYTLSYKEGSMVGYQLWGETALGRTTKDWAFVVGGGLGTIDPDNGNETDHWNVLAGMKYYFSELTSVQILGSYLTGNDDSDLDITGISIGGKQRFMEISDGLSPFLTASLTYRSYDEGNDDDEAELLGMIGLGCEWYLTEGLSIVIEGSYLHGESLESHGPELQDGVLAAIYLTGYWD